MAVFLGYNERMIVTLTDTSREDIISRAVAILRDGGIIAYPTETFYGLGARYDDPRALDRLYALKKRPAVMAMPLIIGSEDQLNLLAASVSDSARALMRRFWPGPLTLIFTAASGLTGPVIAGGRVAVRIPGPSFALDLARVAPFPITATSANISSRPPADTAAMVEDYFNGLLDLVVDGGRAPGGLPSTIADVSAGGAVVLRPGAVTL